MSFYRSAQRAVAHNLKLVNLIPIKSMKFEFDPFGKNVRSVRDIAFLMSMKHVRGTNLNCGLKVNVRCDRRDPTMEVMFNDGHKALFRTSNLNSVEILQELNKLSAPRIPKQPESILETKSTKSKKGKR